MMMMTRPSGSLLTPRLLLRRFASFSLSNTTTNKKNINDSATLRVHGPDQKGIVASLSRVLDHHGCEISQSEQWTDRETCAAQQQAHHLESPNNNTSLFFQRFLFSRPDQVDTRLAVAEQIKETCDYFQLQYTLNWREQRPRVAVLVSKYDHCLWELLLRHEAKELECDIVAVISNHTDLQPVAEQFGIPYYNFPIHDAASKREHEPRQLQLLLEESANGVAPVDLIVLARYMQILSPVMLQHFDGRILNIHHSFLPAFSGASPYRQAFERGVKLIGATAHYVTAALDDGPIIKQDVMTVSHRDTPMRMKQKGRIVERTVLIRAVQAHLDDRIISYHNKCVVFGD